MSNVIETLQDLYYDRNDIQSVTEFTSELITALGGNSQSTISGYLIVDGVVVRIKDHRAVWSNFDKNLEDGYTKFLSVTIDTPNMPWGVTHDSSDEEEMNDYITDTLRWEGKEIQCQSLFIYDYESAQSALEQIQVLINKF